MPEYREFRVTAQHIALIRRMVIGWDETCYEGAPAVDLKRPYGNSDVLHDVAHILGYAERSDSDGAWRELYETELRAIHRETETALQCVLATGSFEPGLYRAERWSRRWQRIGE